MTGLISPLEITDGDRPESPEHQDATGTPPAGDDLALVRELVLKAHPDVVPELIGGDSVASLVASISPAQAAYADLAARIQANSVSSSGSNSVPSSTGSAPRVPAGSTAPAPIDPDRIPTAEKIRRGVRDRAARAASRGAHGGVHGSTSRTAR
jgi:hypothetical protein